MTSKIQNIGMVYINPDELAELREKARLWDKVIQLASNNICKECPIRCNQADHDESPCPFNAVVDALEKEPR